MLYKTNHTSFLGELTIVSNGESLMGLFISGQKYFLNTISNPLIKKDDLDIFLKTKQWLDEYFKGKAPPLNSLPLSPIGSEFRQKVWKILRQIPYGKTITYGEIAKELSNGGKMSAQAVGNAVGHNPISIIIPCHRVLGKNGALTGYAGGIDKKIKLLKLEGVDTTRLN